MNQNAVIWGFVNFVSRDLVGSIDAIEGVNQMGRKIRAFAVFAFLVTSLIATHTTSAMAQDAGCDAACEAARKAANPLADVRALITDNTIAYKTGTNDEDSYNFQLQPVYAQKIQGGNIVWRGIIPIQGVQPGAVLPPGVIDASTEPDLTWGIGDITAQAFYAPTPGPSGLALGYGVQVSLPTATDSALTGAGWGAGPAFVIFGQSGDLSWGGLAAHMWGEGNFSVSVIQPILTYGLGGGWYFGYNNVISYNWNVTNGDEPWTVPLGLTVGKTTVLGDSGRAIDLSLGWYDVNRSPLGGPDSQIKVGLSFFF